MGFQLEEVAHLNNLNNLIWPRELERLHEWVRHKNGKCNQPVQFIVTFPVVILETNNVLQHEPIIASRGPFY